MKASAKPATMKTYDDLFLHEARGVKFLVRKGTSDIKSVTEVVEKLAYRRKGFELESDAWLDLGANIGAFTCLVASLGAKVRAYEPDPVCFAILEQNVRLNKLQNVELVQAAVTTSTQSHAVLHLNSANGNYWRNSLVKTWRGGEDVSVPTVALASLPVAGFDCKMDIEGSEMPVLEAPNLPTWRRLVFEWSFDVDPSIPRFGAVVKKLRSRYSDVRYPKFDETQPVWGTSWFPPCRTVWCSGA